MVSFRVLIRALSIEMIENPGPESSSNLSIIVQPRFSLELSDLTQALVSFYMLCVTVKPYNQSNNNTAHMPHAVLLFFIEES